MPDTAFSRQSALDLISFIDASPSPWHAVASAEQRLQAAGFARLEEGARWALAPGGRYYAVRGGASLIAFVVGARPLAEAGFRIVGAHAVSLFRRSVRHGSASGRVLASDSQIHGSTR